MCGFCGEYRTDGNAPDIGAVAAMAATMEDRGPDGRGLWAQGSVALGHRRLKIIDLSDRAAQPLVDAQLGLTVAFNGCIYNYAELRAELSQKGYTFFSTGDTEVLAKAYDAWGTAFVDRLQGMFAFAISERDSGRLVLGRDRLGIKPLYLSHTPERLRFASTLPALLAGGEVDTRIDAEALQHYLSFHSVVPAPRTILAGVRKLQPATLMICEADGQQTVTRYWEPQFARNPQHRGMSSDDWADAVLAALQTAVKRRLVADVGVGVLLSGGLDSSLIVGLLAEAGQDALATFSVGFEAAGGHAGDEFAYSDVIAQRFATDHHQIRVPTTDLLDSLIPTVAAMSEPMVSHDAVGFYILSREVARHVKVVQSGQGADEVFAGYHWYPPMLDAPGSGVTTYAAAFCDRDQAQMAALLAPEWLAGTDATALFLQQHFAAAGAGTPIDRALRLDTTVMLVDDPVKRVDNMTMAHGLEARVPFLDHELVELAAACPPELKLREGGKGVLKAAARKVIPAAVIDRPKGYFPVPALTHLDGSVLEWITDALHSTAATQRGLFAPKVVADLMTAPNETLTPLGGNRLWQVGLLELWLQTHGI